ncbi:hypothetical protein EI77_04638 [Prosthecobacter fusiformis]|uniref:Uncharacterized protein n=1 Tax=Prosthecobacter fusiformis TaxID=48464 RepID=A0A4R7RK30_9BACT|nr:hypothetical protein [Prosthecobacter fusiformis]TDU62537.1 hypothetical protein EI77_04638 [Prosthecobacter fusiformis]
MSHPAAPFIPLFPEEEIPFILQAVLRCGKQIRKNAPREREDPITDRLRALLDRDPVMRSRPVEIQREVSIYDRKKFKVKQLGRTDIVFLFSTGVNKPWPYYTIECKRLYVTRLDARVDTLIDQYVTSHQGMRCFIDQRYATDLSYGAMLGYVFDGDVTKARDQVAQFIRRHYVDLQVQGEGEMLPSGLQIEGVHETRHLIGDKDFVIHHLFIAV